MMKKKSAFWFAREFIIDMGGGGFYFSFYSVQDWISVKTNEKFESPLPPFQWWKKKARFGLRANSSLIWGEGGFISHFILSKIVGRSVWENLVAGTLRSVCTGDLGQDSLIQTSRSVISETCEVEHVKFRKCYSASATCPRPQPRTRGKSLKLGTNDV